MRTKAETLASNFVADLTAAIEAETSRRIAVALRASFEVRDAERSERVERPTPAKVPRPRKAAREAKKILGR